MSSSPSAIAELLIQPYSPKPERIWMKLDIYVWMLVDYHTKIGERITKEAPKSVLRITNATQLFDHLSCVNFDHFWNNDSVNRWPGAHSRENFCESPTVQRKISGKVNSVVTRRLMPDSCSTRCSSPYCLVSQIHCTPFSLLTGFPVQHFDVAVSHGRLQNARLHSHVKFTYWS